MLTFLRKVRKSLIGSLPASVPGMQAGGSTRKYILYAIGEIALVVIGILIALQINNWNDERIMKIKEVKVLMEIRSNLLSNQKIIEGSIGNAENNKTRITELLDYWDYKRELPGERLHSNLEFVRRLARFEYNDAAYQSVKTLGFDIIQNDTLRLEIINLFENIYEPSQSLINANDGDSGYSLNKVYEQCCPSRNGVIVPDDLSTFKNDRIFYNKLTLRYDWKSYVSDLMKNNLTETKRIINLLDLHLKSRL